MTRLALLVSLAAMGAFLIMDSGGASGSATVDGGSWSFTSGSTANRVEIKVTSLPPEGLGGSDVTIAFDPSVLEITGCTTGVMSGVCNPNAPAGPAQPAGFSVSGPSEPVVIAELDFDCVGPQGSSTALTLTVIELVDTTVGDPQAIPHAVQNGNVMCVAPATPTPVLTPTPVITMTPTPTPAPSPTASPTSGPPIPTSGPPP